jgi:hypothetical protein
MLLLAQQIGFVLFDNLIQEAIHIRQLKMADKETQTLFFLNVLITTRN